MKNELLNSVVVSNEFARYAEINLNLIEWKMLLYLISKIKKHEMLFLEDDFTIRDFAETFDISSYDIIRSAAQMLNAKEFVIKDEKYKLFKYVIISKKKIIYCFDKSMEKHLLGLENNMTIFDLGYVYNLKSKYAVRMYLFGLSFKFIKYYNCDLEFIKKITCSDLYKSEFERRILYKSLSEICDKSNIFLRAIFDEDRGLYHFASVNKNEEQFVKYKVDSWREMIEEKRDIFEISKELFADIDFDKL